MLLKKYDVEKNSYIDYLINYSSSDQNFQFKGGKHKTCIFPQKNQNWPSLKLIFFQINIEGFKKTCNSITIL
jgi:hypothetical protein